MLTVPVLRPEVAREYEEYQAAVDEYNRRRMEEMRKPVPGAPVCMAYAHAAPRCAHVRADGTRCAAPALRERTICYAHTRMLAVRKPGLKLPVLEDAGGIALAAMQVVQQMLDGKLPRRKAATALYGIQIVASTLNHRPFAVYPTSVVTEAEGLPAEEELLESEAVNKTDEGVHRPADGERDLNEQATTPQNMAQDGNPGDHPIAKKEAAQDEDASDQADKEKQSQDTGHLEDMDPSLRSGFLNNEREEVDRKAPDQDTTLCVRPALANNESDPSVQSPLGKEWWTKWEAEVRAIASGAGNAKEPQGVKDQEVGEEGLG